MLYIHHQRGFSHPHEQEQLDTILPILDNYFSGNTNAYLLANVNFGGVEPDAMLVTTNYVIGIEFKDYGSNNRDTPQKVVCMENGPWNVLKYNGDPIKDKEGNALSVKGGTFGNPYDQANYNRKIVKGDLSNFLHSDKIGNSVFWFIVFNRYMEADVQNLNAPWLKVLTNDSIVRQLNLIGSAPIFKDDNVIRGWLARHGISIFCSIFEYPHKKPVVIKESPKYYPDNQQLIKELSEYYAEKANHGRVIFLLIMSSIMTLTMMFRWWWNTRPIWWAIITVLLVAFGVWYFFERRTTRFFRDVPKKGEIIDNRAYINGLNQFNWMSIALNHVCWFLVAFLLIAFRPICAEFLPVHCCAFYDMLRLMSILLYNCGIAIAIGTIISLFYRIYEKITDVDDKRTIFSKLNLSMMPISRLDISFEGYFVRDLRRWIRILIYMSAMVSILWFVFTILADKKLVKQKYTYWPSAFVFGNDDPVPPDSSIQILDMHFKEGKVGNLRLGEKLQLHLVVTPTNHNEELTCDWTKEVAEVRWKNNTLEVTPKKQGVCNITVSSSPSNKTAVFQVNVKKTKSVSSPPPTPLSSSSSSPSSSSSSHTNIVSMSFSEGPTATVKLGEKLRLHLDIDPANHDEELKYEWSKDAYGENIAVVSRVGNSYIVKPMKRGECLITVTSSRTGKEASCLVRVQ
jgi:hypothetical protein